MLDLGDTYTSSIEVYTAPPESGGTLVNPSAVTLTITFPDGTSSTPTPTNTGTGKYKSDLITTQAGRHLFRWVTTAPATAWTDTADVRPAAPPVILSLADAKRALNMSLASTGDDEELRSLNEAVTSMVERHRHEVIARRVVTQLVTLRRHGGTGLHTAPLLSSRRIFLDRLPVLSVTSVTRTDVAATWALTDLVLDKTLGSLSTIGPVFVGDLSVVYTAGFDVIPADYTEAAKIILRHLWATQQQASLGPSGPFGQDGNAAFNNQAFAMPNKALQLLGDTPPVRP